MKEYVLCYAKRLDNRDSSEVILVDKTPPAPRENGFAFVEGSPRQGESMHVQSCLPGDEVQPGEGLLQAAVRALKAETGFDTSVDHCKRHGTIHGVGWAIYVIGCLYEGVPNWQIPGSRLRCSSVGQALAYGSNILPELRTIIPLCLGEKRWQMIIGTEGGINFDYTLQVRE